MWTCEDCGIYGSFASDDPSHCDWCVRAGAWSDARCVGVGGMQADARRVKMRVCSHAQGRFRALPQDDPEAQSDHAAAISERRDSASVATGHQKPLPEERARALRLLGCQRYVRLRKQTRRSQRCPLR